MPRKSNQHDKQFKLDAIQYVSEHPDCPNAVWCTAITYIWTRDGFVY
ncbi:hypothetical protein [Cellulosilyticum ruminicola]|nr:hypothetical protein [Cellulosilyticum ruminicola]